jgi:hypothetical protein
VRADPGAVSGATADFSCVALPVTIGSEQAAPAASNAAADIFNLMSNMALGTSW